MKSFRRCLTTLVVCFAIGVGPGVLGASAEPDDDRGRHCEHPHGHANEEHKDRGNGHRRDEGCKAEKHNQSGRNGGKGHEDEGHDDEGHDDEGHRGKGHDDEGHRGKGHDDESRRGKGHDDEGHDDDGAEQGESRRSGHDRRSDAGALGSQTVPTPTPSEGPDEPAASLDLTVRASRVVAQVGDEIGYTVTVTNLGEVAIADIAVVDLVPPELDVVSVPLAEGVAAQTAGRSPRGEDVVWIIESLPARASLELEWTGVVRAAGDLEATNVVTATFTVPRGATAGSSDSSNSGRPEVQATTTTFLATTAGVAAHRTAPEVMPKRIVTVTRVPAAEAAPGAQLPVTAMGVEWLIVLALTIGFVGMILLIVGRPPLMVGRGSAFALALLAVVYAATFIGDSSSIREPRPSETVEDQVKGKRIFKDGASPSPSPDVPEESPRPDDGEDADSVAAPRDEAPDTVEVRTVRTVRVPVEADPIESGSGANVMGFSWDEPSRSILQATSSLGPITSVPTYELLTSVNMAGDALEATLVLRNLSDELIAVRGVLVHELGGDGVTLTLRSSKIDVILRPRGEALATFRYLLPSGAYQARATFVAD